MFRGWGFEFRGSGSGRAEWGLGFRAMRTRTHQESCPTLPPFRSLRLDSRSPLPRGNHIIKTRPFIVSFAYYQCFNTLAISRKSLILFILRNFLTTLILRRKQILPTLRQFLLSNSQSHQTRHRKREHTDQTRTPLGP